MVNYKYFKNFLKEVSFLTSSGLENSSQWWHGRGTACRGCLLNPFTTKLDWNCCYLPTPLLGQDMTQGTGNCLAIIYLKTGNCLAIIYLKKQQQQTLCLFIDKLQVFTTKFFS